MATLVKIGLLELTVAVLSGWLMVLRSEEPGVLHRLGVQHLRRVRQMHLNFLLMGIILVGVGLAVQPIPTWIATLVAIGAIVQPLLTVPVAFSADNASKSVFKVVTAAVFVGTSIGWIGLAVVIIGR